MIRSPHPCMMSPQRFFPILRAGPASRTALRENLNLQRIGLNALREDLGAFRRKICKLADWLGRKAWARYSAVGHADLILTGHIDKCRMILCQRDVTPVQVAGRKPNPRSEEHTSELQSPM